MNTVKAVFGSDSLTTTAESIYIFVFADWKLKGQTSTNFMEMLPPTAYSR